MISNLHSGKNGFTLIELIVVIVILGILAVTAAPKFMNLTSDANASVVKGMGGAIRTAAHMVYAKSKLPNATADSYVCTTQDCVNRNYAADARDTAMARERNSGDRAGSAQRKRATPSQTGQAKQAWWCPLSELSTTAGSPGRNWVMSTKPTTKTRQTGLSSVALIKIKRAATLELHLSRRARLQQQEPITRSPRQRATGRPIAASFTSPATLQITIVRLNTFHRL